MEIKIKSIIKKIEKMKKKINDIVILVMRLEA